MYIQATDCEDFVINLSIDSIFCKFIPQIHPLPTSDFVFVLFIIIYLRGMVLCHVIILVSHPLPEHAHSIMCRMEARFASVEEVDIATTRINAVGVLKLY